MKQTVVFDFDGVIHSYTSGWQGAVMIPDPPVPGIKEAIDEIRSAGYEVVVVSTRCAGGTGAAAMAEIWKWLDTHGIKVDKVCAEKPPAIVYIDDRAITFDGKPETLLGKIQAFKPWNKKKKTLKPCPFCGGKAKWMYVPPVGVIMCTECGASSKAIVDGQEQGDGKREAVKLWERRAGESNE